MDLHAKVDDDDVVGVIGTVDDFFGSVKQMKGGGEKEENKGAWGLGGWSGP